MPQSSNLASKQGAEAGSKKRKQVATSESWPIEPAAGTETGRSGTQWHSLSPSMWEDTESDEVDVQLNNFPFRTSCFAHSIQLVIRDGLASSGIIRPALAKCSKLANQVQ